MGFVTDLEIVFFCLRLYDPTGLHTDSAERDECWSVNTRGDKYGNCGSSFNEDLTACSQENERYFGSI